MKTGIKINRKTGRKLAAALLAVTVLLAAFPVSVFAASDAAPDMASHTVSGEDEIVLQTQGNMLVVGLTLPNAAGEKISSLQLSLQLDRGSFDNFVFDDQVTGRSKVCEAYAKEDNSRLDLYIAGNGQLYPDGVRTITIGYVTIQQGNHSSVSVQADQVKVVRGIQLEEKDLSACAEFSFAAGYDPGTYVPLQPSVGNGGTQKPQTGENRPEQTPDEPQEPLKPQTEKTVQAPELLKAVNAQAGVTIKWTKSSNASGYYIYRKAPGGRYKRIASVKGKSKASFTDKAVKSKNGKTYIYTVKAFRGKDVSAYEKAGIKIYRLTAPALLKPVSPSAKKLTVKWKRNKKASGYQIQYGRSAGFKEGTTTRKIAASKTLSKKITKLKSKKTYYVRIRSYKKSGKVIYYSAWSKAKKTKVR